MIIVLIGFVVMQMLFVIVSNGNSNGMSNRNRMSKLKEVKYGSPGISISPSRSFLLFLILFIFIPFIFIPFIFILTVLTLLIVVTVFSY